MHTLWAGSAVALLLATCLFGWFSLNAPERGDVKRTSRSVLAPSLPPSQQKVDPEEYERFLEALYATQDARNRFFERVKPIFSPVTEPPSTPPNGSLSKPVISSATFRTYNYSTGEQFEDKWDCDLILLTSLESTLVEKVTKIERMSSAMQTEVLEICQSMDVEFNRLLRYAEKCEQEMGRDTFNILQFIIHINNETIMSCRAKESDWTGFGAEIMQESDNVSDEWVDENGVLHFRNHHKYTNQTCISPAQVYRCFMDSFGQFDFDVAREAISTRAQCDALLRFDRCIKQWIFEVGPTGERHCTLEEKEISLEILRGMFTFDLNRDGEESDQQLAQCRSIRDLWSQSNYAVAKKRLLENDAAFRMTETLRSAYQMIKGADCFLRTWVDDELCLGRFEQRTRKLWHNQGIDNMVNWEDEKQMMCCATAELASCMATFVLIRCGIDQFGPYQERLEFMRISSLPDDCATLSYSSSHCHATLY